MDDNPLKRITAEVPFDRIRAEHVEPAVDALIDEATQAIERIAARGPDEQRWETTLGALEEATDPLERTMSVVSLLESVATTDELREAYNVTLPKVSELFSSIPLHEGLWKVLRAYADTDEAKQLDSTRARLLEKTLDELRRHGAELDAEGKERLSDIDVEMSRLTTKFSQNVLDSTNAFELVVTDESRLAGLPESARQAARESARTKGVDGWRFTLQAPSVIAVLSYLEDDAIREQVWRAFNTRATSGEHDNAPIIRRILELRQQKAELLGYDDFADFITEDRMAKSGKRARGFVDDLRERVTPFFERENEQLRAFRREQLGEGAGDMKPWEVGYWSEQQRKALYDFDDEELRPYFSVERVLGGLFQVAERLYGIRIEPHEMPAWHEDVRTYAVRDADGTLRASFYADLFPREQKRDGAWMSVLVTGVAGEPEREQERSPHLALFCANVTPPTGDEPARLTHREVETLFHEFGHLLHQILSEVSVRSLAGTRVAWDFVELPSQIMENWTWEREALDLFARHVETDEPIPDELYDKMLRARSYRAANQMMRQLGFATVDLALHVDWDPERDGDLRPYAKEILERHASTPLPDDYSMITGFGHLFSSPVAYAAGYYSYKWAEVLEADAFSRFKDRGVFDPEVGRAFREHILSKGDSRDPEELFEAFMGRGPRVEALLERDGLVGEAA